MAPSASPALLVSAAARGNSTAFEHVYREHAPALRGFVCKAIGNTEDAEDLCQEIWLKAYRALETLRQPGAFSSWLYRMALRVCLSERRKLGRRRALAPDAGCDPEAVENPSVPPFTGPWAASEGLEADPLAALLRQDEGSLAWEALACLPARQHVALHLREVESCSYEEVAQRMGTSVPAVESLLFRARKGFARAYQVLEDDPAEGCRPARAAADALDRGRATEVQRTALRLHLQRCHACRLQPKRRRRVASFLGWPAGWITFYPHLPWGGPAIPPPSLAWLRATEWLGGAGACVKAGVAMAAIATAAVAMPDGIAPWAETTMGAAPLVEQLDTSASVSWTRGEIAQRPVRVPDQALLEGSEDELDSGSESASPGPPTTPSLAGVATVWSAGRLFSDSVAPLLAGDGDGIGRVAAKLPGAWLDGQASLDVTPPGAQLDYEIALDVAPPGPLDAEVSLDVEAPVTQLEGEVGLYLEAPTLAVDGKAQVKLTSSSEGSRAQASVTTPIVQFSEMATSGQSLSDVAASPSIADLAEAQLCAPLCPDAPLRQR